MEATLNNQTDTIQYLYQGGERARCETSTGRNSQWVWNPLLST